MPKDPAVIATETDYGGPFCSMIWRDNLFATQFHPEKSQRDGLRMLRTSPSPVGGEICRLDRYQMVRLAETVRLDSTWPAASRIHRQSPPGFPHFARLVSLLLAPAFLPHGQAMPVKACFQEWNPATVGPGAARRCAAGLRSAEQPPVAAKLPTDSYPVGRRCAGLAAPVRRSGWSTPTR